MVRYVAHRCYCQLAGGVEGSYVVSRWKYDVCFSQGIAVVAEVSEVSARTYVKVFWKLCQRVAALAESREVSSSAGVKVVWKLGKSAAVGAEI